MKNTAKKSGIQIKPMPAVKVLATCQQPSNCH